MWSRNDWYGGAKLRPNLDGTFELPARVARVWVIEPTANRDVELPDATRLQTGWSLYLIVNVGSAGRDLTIKDNSGSTTIATVTPGNCVELALVDNSTSGGLWFGSPKAYSAQSQGALDYVMAFGGASASDQNDYHQYDIGLDTWTFYDGTAGHAVKAVGRASDDKLYTQSGTSFYQYLRSTDTWTSRATKNYSNAYSNPLLGVGTLRVIAYNEGDPDASANEVEEYNITGNSWASLSSPTDSWNNCSGVEQGSGIVYLVYFDKGSGGSSQFREHTRSGDTYAIKIKPSSWGQQGRYNYDQLPVVAIGTDAVHLFCGAAATTITHLSNLHLAYSVAGGAWATKLQYPSFARMLGGTQTPGFPERCQVGSGRPIATNQHWQYNDAAETFTVKAAIEQNSQSQENSWTTSP